MLGVGLTRRFCVNIRGKFNQSFVVRNEGRTLSEFGDGYLNIYFYAKALLSLIFITDKDAFVIVLSILNYKVSESFQFSVKIFIRFTT